MSLFDDDDDDDAPARTTAGRAAQAAQADDIPTEIHRRARGPVVSPPGQFAPARGPLPVLRGVEGDESQMTLVNRVLGEQEQPNTAAESRIDQYLARRRGVQPDARPRSLREIATDREARREADEQRHARHQRRMDMYEEIRSILGLVIIVLSFVGIVAAGFYAVRYGIVEQLRRRD